MNAFTAELPLPPSTLSPNERAHWAVKAKAVRIYREACAFILHAAKPQQWDRRHPVIVDVQYRAHRGCGGFHPRDEDNARSALKAAFDAFKDAGVVLSDAKRKVRWGSFELVTTEREIDRMQAKPGVTVTVRQEGKALG